MLLIYDLEHWSNLDGSMFDTHGYPCSISGIGWYASGTERVGATPSEAVYQRAPPFAVNLQFTTLYTCLNSTLVLIATHRSEPEKQGSSGSGNTWHIFVMLAMLLASMWEMVRVMEMLRGNWRNQWMWVLDQMPMKV